MKKLFIICLSLFCYQFLSGQMYPGRATNQGAAGGQGNQDITTGAPDVHVYGKNGDIGGNSVALTGRSLVGRLPVPAYNGQDQGTVTVIVAITVDKEGNVTKATPGARGTTTFNKTLLDAAGEAARKAKFSRKPDAVEQTGTITYVFKPADVPEQTLPEQTKPAERTINPRAPYPGRGNSASTAASQGDAGGQGNQGVTTGVPDVHVYGEGGNVGEGNKFALTGRNLVGRLPLPVYTVLEQGAVVVAITVDKDGNVIKTTPGAKGSTTLNKTLLDAAEKAARQAKFSHKPDAMEQTGTITYVFKSADSSSMPGSRANDYDDKYPINAAGERTIFKGPATVSFELSRELSPMFSNNQPVI